MNEKLLRDLIQFERARDACRTIQYGPHIDSMPTQRAPGETLPKLRWHLVAVPYEDVPAYCRGFKAGLNGEKCPQVPSQDSIEQQGYRNGRKAREVRSRGI
jgi:hypothetical protein